MTVLLRTESLRKKHYLRNNRLIVHLDKTWVNNNYSISQICHDSNRNSGLKVLLREGQMLTAVLAGSKKFGFFRNTVDYPEQRGYTDYHHGFEWHCIY